MPQVMERKRKKRPADPDLEFDAGKVFDVKPAVDLQEESATYKAAQGQGGDRRA